MGQKDHFSLDNPNILDQAHRQPLSLVESNQPLTIDEVQKCPALLPIIKQIVDQKRQPGQFLLTGSANLLLGRTINESLTGRASYINLRSLTRFEQLGLATAGIWSQILDHEEAEWKHLIDHDSRRPEDNLETILSRGGLPVPALLKQSGRRRQNWFNDYCQTYIERDLRDLAAISQTVNLRRLMKLMATRVGQVLNMATLSRRLGISQPTVNRYINLLEASYWLSKLPAYRSSRGQRIIKSPKVYWNDAGLALHLGGDGVISGSHLENFVYNDLIAWSENRNRFRSPTNIYYWRTTNGREVDFMVESGNMLLPIEVKLTNKPDFRDCRHLLAFQAEFPKKSRAGLLLHTGHLTDWIAPNVLALPWWKAF